MLNSGAPEHLDSTPGWLCFVQLWNILFPLACNPLCTFKSPGRRQVQVLEKMKRFLHFYLIEQSR